MSKCAKDKKNNIWRRAIYKRVYTGKLYTKPYFFTAEGMIFEVKIKMIKWLI